MPAHGRLPASTQQPIRAAPSRPRARSASSRPLFKETLNPLSPKTCPSWEEERQAPLQPEPGRRCPKPPPRPLAPVHAFILQPAVRRAPRCPGGASGRVGTEVFSGINASDENGGRRRSSQANCCGLREPLLSRGALSRWAPVPPGCGPWWSLPPCV